MGQGCGERQVDLGCMLRLRGQALSGKCGGASRAPCSRSEPAWRTEPSPGRRMDRAGLPGSPVGQCLIRPFYRWGSGGLERGGDSLPGGVSEPERCRGGAGTSWNHPARGHLVCFLHLAGWFSLFSLSKPGWDVRCWFQTQSSF